MPDHYFEIKSIVLVLITALIVIAGFYYCANALYLEANRRFKHELENFTELAQPFIKKLEVETVTTARELALEKKIEALRIVHQRADAMAQDLMNYAQCEHAKIEALIDALGAYQIEYEPETHERNLWVSRKAKLEKEKINGLPM